MTTVISVENLSKTYRLGQIGTGTFTYDLAVWWAKVRGKPNPLLKIGQADHGNRDGEELMALRDVSFTVQQGEVLGIIGRNGAGKSTLLKILSRVTAPTSGRIRVKGRVASLLEVGTGFHPELTGRENIYLNGAILGMTRQEVTRKFDEIVDFAGVEKFIDTPVKRYSSGMYVRLAFAVAAHLDPEILVVDEVLAVGDAEFQKKCLGKMGEVAQGGRTVLFVSHNMASIQMLCHKTALMNQGRVIKIADTRSAIHDYLSGGNDGEFEEFFTVLGQKSLRKKGVHLLRVSIKNAQGFTKERITGDSSFFCEMEYFLEDGLPNLRVGFRIINSDGIVLFTTGNTDLLGGGGQFFRSGHYTSHCEIPGNLLSPGRYWVTVTCDQPMQEIIFVEESIISFNVDERGSVGSSVADGRYGVIRPVLHWSTTRKE